MRVPLVFCIILFCGISIGYTEETRNAGSAEEAEAAEAAGSAEEAEEAEAAEAAEAAEEAEEPEEPEEPEESKEKNSNIEPIEKPESPKEKLEERARKKQEAKVVGSWGAAAMPFFAYTPEYGGMFGVAGLTYRVPEKAAEKAPETAAETAAEKAALKEEEREPVPTSDPSILTASLIYSTREAFITTFSGDASVLRDRVKVELLGGGKYLPGRYWGIGPEADDRENYVSNDYTFEIKTGFRIFRYFYGGPLYEFDYYSLLETKNGGELDVDRPEGTSIDTLVSGPGFRLFWDSTKGGLFPFDGVNMQLTGKIFREEFGSSNDFSLLTVDARGYLNTFFSHVAALQVMYQSSTGDPPFQMLPSLGGEETMRGHFMNRYLDSVALSSRIEYRAPLSDRIGLVAFFSAGQVGKSFSDLSTDNLKTAGGGGVRFTLQKRLRLNLRVDLAFSEEGILPYINVQEAF